MHYKIPYLDALLLSRSRSAFAQDRVSAIEHSKLGEAVVILLSTHQETKRLLYGME